MPEVVSVHISQALTNLSAAYGRSVFGAERLLPNVPVSKMTDEYYVFDNLRRALAAQDDTRTEDGEANTVDFGFTTGSYTAKGHALRTKVTDEEAANADDAFDLMVDKMDLVMAKLFHNRERELKTALEAGVTGSYAFAPPNGFWNDYDTGTDPFDDIDQAITLIEETTGFRPNVAMWDTKVTRALMKHPLIIDRVLGQGSNEKPAQVSLQALTSLFGFEEIIEHMVLSNSAAETAAASITRLWGSDVYIAYRTRTPGRKVPTLGYRFNWTPFGGRSGFRVTRWRDEGRKCVFAEAESYYSTKLVVPTAAVRLTTVLG